MTTYNAIAMPAMVMLKDGAKFAISQGQVPPTRACEIIDAALA
jgi:hypothetical protein